MAQGVADDIVVEARSVVLAADLLVVAGLMALMMELRLISLASLRTATVF